MNLKIFASLTNALKFHKNCKWPGKYPGGNAIYVPYGDVPPIRVYFLAFESETGCLFSSLTLKQGAKFLRSIQARVPIHSTVWHPHVGFKLFVFWKLIPVLMFSTY